MKVRKRRFTQYTLRIDDNVDIDWGMADTIFSCKIFFNYIKVIKSKQTLYFD